jgi:phage terminase large subunit-like protein
MINQYIEDVKSGKRNAGRLERLMVDRHLADLKLGRYVFDEEEAERVITIVMMLRHTSGVLASELFNLQPFQAFILAVIFGWKRKDGTRRFRRAYVEIARKNGKSELAAAIVVLMLVFNGEAGAQIYSAATTKEQASIVFKAAKKMLRMLCADSQAINNIVRLYQHSVTGPKDSIFKAVTSDSGTLDGLNPYGAIVDEYHEHKDDGVLQVLQTGMGSRVEPLLFVITTAGFNLNGPCARLRKIVMDILEQKIDDNSQFGAIFSIDEGDDWEDKGCWSKANPNIGQTPSWEFMEDQLKAAQNEGSSAQTQFRTKNLNVWMRASKVWIPDTVWQECKDHYTLADMEGMECYGGLDLSARIDISAFSLFFPIQPGLDKPRILLWYWLPEDRIYARKLADGVPYPQWVDEGHIKPTEGNMIDYKQVANDIMHIVGHVKMQVLAYDRMYVLETILILNDAGVNTLPWAQVASKMSPGTKELERMVVGRIKDESDIGYKTLIAHNGDPVMRWMIGNVEIKRDQDDNMKIDKGKSKEKVDGPVATVMALGAYLDELVNEQKKAPTVSKYATMKPTVIKI